MKPLEFPFKRGLCELSVLCRATRSSCDLSALSIGLSFFLFSSSSNSENVGSSLDKVYASFIMSSLLNCLYCIYTYLMFKTQTQY